VERSSTTVRARPCASSAIYPIHLRSCGEPSPIGNAAGWDVCLDRLAGLDPAPDAWRSHFDAYSSAFEQTLGPQEGPPAGYRGD
jgi:hypothetical protein